MGIIMLLLPDDIVSNGVAGVVGGTVLSGGGIVGGLRMIFGGQVEPPG